MIKNLFFTILSFLFALTVSGQLVINEIMYNPPESGTDSLEYIEILNTGNSAINLVGYSMTGVEYVFDNFMLEPAGYVVLSINPDALMNNFGVTSLQWTSGALKNGGEIVGISDDMGNLIDQVEYLPDSGWPSNAEGTAGEGASIELCDPSSDNSLFINWAASSNDTGIEINGKSLRGTPGAENGSCGPPDPDYIIQTEGFTFNPPDITIGVNETIEWQNTGGSHNVNGETDVYPANPEGFSSGAPSADLWTFQHTFTIPGFYEYQCDPHAGFGMKGTITVISDEEPAEYPLYSIGEMTNVDANGVGDSLDVKCELQGIVYGGNLRSGGYLFTIIDDNNDGVAVFLNNGNLGYVVNEGDEVSVKGEMTQYNGLLELVPDSITMLSSGNPLFDPTPVTILGEDTESQFIYLEGLEVKNPADWKGDGSSFNIVLTDGTNDIEMRIDDDVDLASMPLPGTMMNVTGIGGQFDSSSPYDSGYQVFPRSSGDLDIILSAVTPGYSKFTVYPNPVADKLQIVSDEAIQEIEIYNEAGLRVISVLETNVIAVNHLTSGVYILKVRTVSGKTGIERISKL